MYQNDRNRYRSTTDYGPEPFIANVDQAAMANPFFRTTLWTGTHLQMTLMELEPGEDIGLEAHHDLDQFLMVVSGFGRVTMGKTRDRLNYQRVVQNGFGIFVPAETWHNLINTGNRPLKLYSIYAPPAHPHGTVHQTKAIAEQEEKHY